LRTKDETFEKFKEFKKMVENKKENRIKVLIINRGGKYSLESFLYFMRKTK